MKTPEAYTHFIVSDPYFGQLVAKCFANPAQDLRGKTVIDVGCGGGLMTVFFALNGATVIGIDIDQETLDAAREWATEWGVLNQCQFVQAKAETLPLADESADLVFSRSTLQYVDRQRAIPHYCRILKPAGTLILIENLPYNPFVGLFRLKRWLTASSEREAAYLNSIRGYVGFGELTQYAAQFRTAHYHYLHLSRVVWVFLQTNPKTANSRAARWADTVTNRLDNRLLGHIPSSCLAAWYVGLVAIGKIQTTEPASPVPVIS